MADPKLPRESLPAAPLARDEAIALLQEHYAVGNLEVAEFEKRVERAENARTDVELKQCLEGLPALAKPVALEKVSTAAVPSVSAVLGATTRRGRWSVPSRLRLRAILGSVEVDLCEAEFQQGETVIEVNVFLGSISITVPEGLAVECQGDALLGSFDHLGQQAGNRWDARRVRIVGHARLGSVEVLVKPRTGVLEGIKALITGR
jgi:hypothetical protein